MCVSMCEDVCVRSVVGTSPASRAIHCDSMMSVFYCGCVSVSHTVEPVALCQL